MMQHCFLVLAITIAGGFHLVDSFQLGLQPHHHHHYHPSRRFLPSSPSTSRCVYKEDGSQSFVSHEVLDHDYLLPSTSKQTTTTNNQDTQTPSSTTTGIHEAYRRCQWTGGNAGEESVMVKTSTDHEAMQREVDNVARVQRHAEDDVVVEIYDHSLIPAGENGGAETINQQKDAVIVMERGENDMLAYLDENYDTIWGAGGSLRNIVYSIAKSIEAIHAAGLVWTDVKLTNFVVMGNSNNERENRNYDKASASEDRNQIHVKAIDLESCVPSGSHPRKFTPSSCPPEMSPVLKGMAYLDGLETVPQHHTDFSFDVWSFGLLVFSLVTQQGFHPSNMDFEFMARRLDGLGQSHVDTVVLSADDDIANNVGDSHHHARDFILACLRVNPKERPTIQDLLEHPFIARDASTEENMGGSMAERQHGGPSQDLLIHQDSYSPTSSADGVELESDHLSAYDQQLSSYRRS